FFDRLVIFLFSSCPLPEASSCHNNLLQLVGFKKLKKLLILPILLVHLSRCMQEFHETVFKTVLITDFN
ncbi:MAG: hypothetical protein NZ852_06520, partial [SAR324 cluster bacterium]|nr:hypothetical protein [SAR324 cluster bacterium]